jgi:hypothetical protein
MIWHMCMEHYMDELLIDEVCIFWTSSMDCAYTTSLMNKWNMFVVCSLRGLQHAGLSRGRLKANRRPDGRTIGQWLLGCP